MMARSLVEMPQRHLNQGRCHLPVFQAFEPLGTTRPARTRRDRTESPRASPTVGFGSPGLTLHVLKIS